MKSILLQCICRKSMQLLSCLLAMLFFSTSINAQKEDYRERLFDGKAKCGMEEMVKQAREAGLYDDMMKAYGAFAKEAKEAYDARQALKTDSDCPNLIVIPVSFHIFHEPGAAIGTMHNWSMAQLDAVLGSLNADFGGYNTNKDLIDECFQDVDAYNTCIQFCYGRITRIPSNTCGNFGQDYGLSACSHDDPNDFLNIYSSDIGGLGIASNIPFPGNEFGACPETYDGVYVDWDAFTIGPPAAAPFDGGKTLTHEIGHWLGLFHIGGDGGCGADDMIGDTPTQNGQNTGCPAGINSCTDTGTDKPDMYFNHMDYSDDACLAMFSQGQAAIMQQVLSPGFCRENIACSAGRGNCDMALAAASTLVNTPSAANSQDVTITDCEGDLDLLDIQFAWYGYATGTMCFNWVEGGVDVAQIGDFDAVHANTGCGGGDPETHTFNLEMQAWDEVNKTWGATMPGGTVNLTVECPPVVAASDSQMGETLDCSMNPMLSATCPACPCVFDNANMTMTVTVTGIHTWVSDLAFYLQGPDGTIVTMGNSTCSNSGDDFNGLTFTSGATTTFDGCGAGTPLTGTYTVDFSSLDGSDFNTAGWNLIIGDCANFDTGSLTSFMITVTDDGGGNSCLAGTAGLSFSGGSGAGIADNMCGGGLTEGITFPAAPVIPATITWWDAMIGGTQVGSGASFDTGTDPGFDNSTNGTTTYYVACGCAPCESNRIAVDAVIQNCIPVELLAFTGTADDARVLLDWTTASEYNNSHFEVERSFDGQKFSVLGKVQGVGTTVTTQLYNFIDLAPKAGINYYRLKQVDFDGTFEYSSTIAVDMSKEQLTTEVFPSPAADVLNVRVNKELEYIQIFDLTGRAVIQYRPAGASFVQLNVSDLLSGTYFVSIQSENTSEVVRFIKE